MSLTAVLRKVLVLSAAYKAWYIADAVQTGMEHIVINQ